MTHVSIWLISSMIGVNTAETELAIGSPCKLKFTTKSDEPSGVIDIVAGKSPTSAESTNRSVPVSIFQIWPYG